MNVSKKILICLPNDILGGAEQYLKMIAIFYNRIGYEVLVLFLTKKKGNGWDDVSSFIQLSYGKKSSEKYSLLDWLVRLKKNKNNYFEKVFTSHTHLTGMMGFLRNLGLIKTKYFIGRESTSIFLRFNGLRLMTFKFLYRFGFKYIDVLVCQTDSMRVQLLNGLPWLEMYCKVVVLSNPIDLHKINSLSSHDFLPELDTNIDYIVSAGRLIPEKGFDILINAFADIKVRFPDLKLIILGEGNQRGKLQELINSLKLQDSVFLFGYKPNVYPFFREAKACCVSSRIEGFPNVLLQMMAVNNNVISTKCAGGIEDIPGLYVSPVNDSKELSLGIIQLLLDSNSELNRREKFDKYLHAASIDNFVNKLNSLLN